MGAEDAEVVDAEVATEGEVEEADSVFDGQKRSQWRTKAFGQWYNVYRKEEGDFRWTITEKRGGPVVAEGAWVKEFSMPRHIFEKEMPRIRQQAWKKVRKLRKLWAKKGKPLYYPNGVAKYVKKALGSPFISRSKEFKLEEKPEWWRHPNEVESKARHLRAKELKRRMAIEVELKRLERLRELGVWTGNEEFRRRWRPPKDGRFYGQQYQPGSAYAKNSAGAQFTR